MAKGSAVPWGDEDFGTYWIVAGHRIREQIDDDQLLVRFLRVVLPPYCGEALTLYRGESRERFLGNRIGLAWTTSKATAEMFASGLNSIGGGVVLRALFNATDIITAPNAHSRYLGEHQYTVDPSSARSLEVLAEFPSNAA